MKSLLFISVLAVSVSAHATYGIRSAGADVTLSESITDLGGGQYKYDYVLNNVNAVDSVWWWGVYSNSENIGGAFSSMENSTTQYIGGSGIEYGSYSGVGYAWDWDGYSYSAGGVTVGSSSTLSFVSDVYDTSDKAFFADITGEYTGFGTLPYDGSTQTFSYMGNTQAVPEPMSMLVLAVGSVALLRRRRK